MDEKALLEAMSQMMDEKLKAERENIRQMIQEENAPIVARMDDFDASHRAIRADIATLNHEIIPKVNAMYDGITGINEKFQRLDRLESRLENHGDRILALEYVLKTK